MNRLYSAQDTTRPRPPVRLARIGVFLAVSVLGAAIELIWGDKIVNWLEGGRLAHERASIIASYYRAVESGSLPRPANSNEIKIFHLNKGAPQRMAVQVRTESGEMHHYQLMRQAGTNWEFRAN